MSNRINWLGPAGTTLFSMVSNHPSGKVAIACREVSKQSAKVFGRALNPQAVEKAYYTVRRRLQSPGTAIVPSRSDLTMTATEAMEFYQFIKQFNITING